MCLLLAFAVYKVHGSLRATKIQLLKKSTCLYWAFTCAASAVWVYLSGIGSYVYQNADYWARNPIFRDLSTYSWPVIYDFSTQSETVQEILGSGTAALSYYFSWWLPVAGVSQWLGLGAGARNLLLSLWAFLGVMLVIYCLNRWLGKCSVVVPVVLVTFSGLDIIGYYIQYSFLSYVWHLEWWGGFWQYSSNTTQLFWVFNQALPIWLIVGIMLQFRDTRYLAAVASLTFAYSPWATIGILPIATGGSYLKEKGNFKKIFNAVNILLPLVMLLIYGLFYLASSGSSGGEIKLIFWNYPDKKYMLYKYILFVILEVGIYFLILGKKAWRNQYYWIVLVELILLPFLYIHDVNFVMRASIPGLFLLMTFIIRYLTDRNEKFRIRKGLLVLALLIGTWTPFVEVNRTVTETRWGWDILQEDVYSFGAIRTDDPDRIQTAGEQFFIFDYEDSLFFQYLGR